MEDLFDPEEKIMCPYNSSHHIRRCKMSFHLVKCKKNYGEQKMIPCDFNVTHMIPEPELQYHHQTCVDRKKIEAQMVNSQSRNENKFPIPNINVAADENWDDMNCQSYDPVKYSENSDVLRHLDVASGAKRKNFRLDERKRLSELSRQSNNNTVPIQSPEKQGGVNLPPHRTVTNISEDTVNRSSLKEKLKMGANKVFLQYEPGTSEHE